MCLKFNIKLKKIEIEINNKQKVRVFELLDNFKNISIFPKNSGYVIELFVLDSEFDNQLKNRINKYFKSYIIYEVENKNWINQNKIDDKGIESQLFFISQGLKKKTGNKKYKLTIPANIAFGTGNHESTFLAIKAIEYVIKKKKFKCILDLGSGSGILSFVLKRILMSKIISTDIDEDIKQCFFDNLKNNNLNDIHFIKADGFKAKELFKHKFDLIVSNMLCNFQKEFIKDYYFRLKKRGQLIISGILDIQENEIIIICGKFNLTLKKKIYVDNWVSLVFIKKGN